MHSSSDPGEYATERKSGRAADVGKLGGGCALPNEQDGSPPRCGLVKGVVPSSSLSTGVVDESFSWLDRPTQPATTDCNSPKTATSARPPSPLKPNCSSRLPCLRLFRAACVGFAIAARGFLRPTGKLILIDTSCPALGPWKIVLAPVYCASLSFIFPHCSVRCGAQRCLVTTRPWLAPPARGLCRPTATCMSGASLRATVTAKS